MAMFRKKPQGIEGELIDARRKRDQLKQRLEAAEGVLAQALHVRRATLLEAANDSSDGTARNAVTQARDEVDALSDALAEVEERITGIEARLVQARAQAERDAAASDLLTNIDALAQALDGLQAAGKTVVAALTPVCSCTPFSNASFPKDLADLLVNINSTISETLTRARQQVEQLTNGGDARIVRPIEMPPPAPTVPQGERRQVILVANARWTEPNGEIMTGPRWGAVDLPAQIAARALASKWALDPDGEVARRLRAGQTVPIGQVWARPPFDYVAVDLSTERLPQLPPGMFGRTVGDAGEGEAPAVN